MRYVDVAGKWPGAPGTALQQRRNGPGVCSTSGRVDRRRRFSLAMDTMPLVLGWEAVVIRLVFALVAGFVFGFNRSESGKTAGLRTTILVCLASCVAMLEVNSLLSQAGKRPDSFPTLDLMRLPLGVLTGMGFIGAGAVMRKDGLVTGVTTAATLWFVTIVGLCIGGGQYRLSASAIVLGLAVLWGLHYVEQRMHRRKSAWLTVEYAMGSECTSRLARELAALGCSVTRRGAAWRRGDEKFEERLLVRWREPFDQDAKVSAFAELARRAGADGAHWQMVE